MDQLKFPVIIKQEPNIIELQSTLVLSTLNDYLIIILKRIQEEKELFLNISGESMAPHSLLQTLALDIKSLFIFSKIYLDYFISYIVFTFFPNYNLKYRSVNDHIKSLKTTKIDDPLFENYKNYVLSCENHIKLRIRYVRDKLITHRKGRITESYLFDDQLGSFLIMFDKTKNPINVDRVLKEKIINLGKKYNIEKEHDKSQISEFIYLDLILGELETSEITFEEGDLNLIEGLRDQLGMVINEGYVYKFLYEFSENIAKLISFANS